MNFPIHGYPYDYWRFTPEGFKSILKPSADSSVGFAGRDDFPHTVIGVGFKGTVPQLSEFKRMYEEWKELQMAQEKGTALKRIVKLLTPPIFIPVLSSIYRATSGPTKGST